MRILVTGHLGYIGVALCQQLKESGHEIHGLDIDLYSNSFFGYPSIYFPSLKLDIRDIRASHLQNYNAIIHLAGLSNDPLGEINPRLTYEINYLATKRLAELAKESGVERFIFASSCSNYGSGTAYHTEDSPVNPLTYYAKSKELAERAILQMSNDDFSVTALRIATVYGYSPKLRFDLVVNNLTAWAYTTGEVFLKSTGKAWRPFIHVMDLCRVMVHLITANKNLIKGQIINVGNESENYTILDIAEEVRTKITGSRVVFSNDAEDDFRNYMVSFDKIRSILPLFKFEWNISKGIDDLITQFKRMNLSPNSFESSQYRRVKNLKQNKLLIIEANQSYSEVYYPLEW